MKGIKSVVFLSFVFTVFDLGFVATSRSGFVVSAAETQRVLLMPVNLTTYGQKKYKWLYKFLDVSAVKLTSIAMYGVYSKFFIQTGSYVTEKNFVQGLQKLGSTEGSPEVDVFLHLHGATHGLMFHEGYVSENDLANDLVASRPNSKPYRYFMSTACWGANHAKALTSAGAFRVASGSVAVNADSAYAYPTAMKAWKNGNPVKSVIAAANQPTLIKIQDKIAKWMGFKDANSFKEVAGNEKITLQSKF